MTEEELIVRYVAPALMALELIAATGCSAAIRRVGLSFAAALVPLAVPVFYGLAMVLVFLGNLTPIEAMTVVVAIRLVWGAVALRFGFGNWPAIARLEGAER